jgi:hypothetical protein
MSGFPRLREAGSRLLTKGPAGRGETFGASGLTGSITYDYTPATPPIPEPSTWAMMLVGFAGLGYAGWRAQRRTAAAA